MTFIKKLFSLLFLSVIAGAAGFSYWVSQPLIQSGKSIEFVIKPGSSVRVLAREIQDAGVPMQPILFEALARISAKANKMKAGSFELKPGETPLDVLNKIVNGEFSQDSLVIIEGWTFRQMRNLIDAHPSLKHDSAGLTEKELMKKINSSFLLPEGLFFPDTYIFPKGASDLQIYQQAHQSMLKHLDEIWKEKNAVLPYKTPYDALIMASIVEKETGQASERAMIASVFTNRLKMGMLLQTDPTVIYGMGEQYKGKIHKRDLLGDTPYNTYTRPGLPPTPIALPGMASLSAAMNPANSSARYFVARGDGSSQFSANLTDHNRAVNKFQR